MRFILYGLGYCCNREPRNDVLAYVFWVAVVEVVVCVLPIELTGVTAMIRFLFFGGQTSHRVLKGWNYGTETDEARRIFNG
jgi:hypothetical protein